MFGKDLKCLKLNRERLTQETVKLWEDSCVQKTR